MPRPLIIKIESSATNPNRTVPSLPLKLRSKSESDAVMVPTNNVGLVRSLINLYEPSSKLTKAKSLQSLERREPVRRRSQIESPTVGKNEEKFNFKSVRMKFETSVALKKSTKTVNGIGVQEKARQLLLDEYRGIDDQLWRERVVELLKEICNGGSSEEMVEKSSTVLDEKQEKVRDMANLYEGQISTGSIAMKPKESFTKYFSNTGDRDGDSSSTESESSQGSQPNSSGGVKITELRSYFEVEPTNGECERVTGINGERLIPPTKITVLEDDQVKRSMEKIAALIRDIENQQRRIVELSRENYEEGAQINEKLIQALIHLDEVPIFGDVSLQAERKKGILLVQTSIRQLIDNRRSYN